MAYFEYNGLHYFHYGLLNLWEDGLTVEEHWSDADPPSLKPAVLADIEEWGGAWNPEGLEIRFPNATGATLWKLKYAAKSKCTQLYRCPDLIDENGVHHLDGEGLGDLK